MRVLLLGTGAADGWPNPWCSCASCTWARAEPGRVRTHTSALLDGAVLIDSGPDVPRQADRAGVGLAAVRAVLLTHGHWDHADPAALLARTWAGNRDPLQLLGPAHALSRFAQWRGPTGAEAADGIELVVLRPGEEVDVAGYRVSALAAAHGDGGDAVADEALLYDVTGPDGSRLLYATDTGPLPVETLGAVTGRAYDLVLLDATFGSVTDHGTGHLDLATFPLVLAELRRRGAVTAGTQVVAVHLGHHNPPGPELDRRLAAWGARAVPDLTDLTVPSVVPGEGGPVSVLSNEGHLHRSPQPRRELVLGGARSGKSRYAESRLAAAPKVTYVATGGVRDGDAEWAARVAAHRARRPAGWHTVETADVATYLRAAGPDSAVLVDCLALWLTAELDDAGAWAGRSDDTTDRRVEQGIAELVDAVRSTRAHLVLVSNEVGSGVVPEHASGRLFRDRLGELNARIGAECDTVTLVVAGRALRLSAD